MSRVDAPHARVTSSVSVSVTVSGYHGPSTK